MCLVVGDGMGGVAGRRSLGWDGRQVLMTFCEPFLYACGGIFCSEESGAWMRCDGKRADGRSLRWSYQQRF